jgi:DNA-binding IclR family transcriptional regulator
VAGNGSEPRRSVISKVVAIVRSFDSGGSLTVTEIAHVADLPLSTVHRLAHELAAWGILHRRDDGRFEAVLCTRSGHGDWPPDLRALAAPTVDDLYTVTKNDVRLGVLDGPRVSYVEKTDGSRPLSDFSEAAKLPAHATALGRALLAFSPAETVDHLVRYGLRSYTSSTVTTAARLRHALNVVRMRGVAVVSHELLPDHSAAAVPVFGPDGEAVAALEVRLRDVRAELPCVVPALTIAARALCRDLGPAEVPPVPARPATQELSTAPVVLRNSHGTVRALSSRIGRRR